MGWLSLAVLRERLGVLRALNLSSQESGITDIRSVYNDSAFTQRLRRWTAHGNNSSINAAGGPALTVTGTATNSATSNASVYDISGHLESLVTVASTSAVVGFHAPTLQQCLQTGFTFFCEWAPATGVATATNRAFCGLHNSTSAPTDVQPSGLTDLFGIGWDAADTNVQFMHNDNADTCTKVDLGSNFAVPTTDRTQVYQLRMYSLPSSGVVNYTLIDVNTGNTASGTISANLPALTTMIGPRVWMSVGGTSSVIGIAFYDMWLKSAR